jgi:hypothetical protein
VSELFITILAAIILLLVTWFAGEWACRRITARYASRRRAIWGGVAPEEVNFDEWHRRKGTKKRD